MSKQVIVLGVCLGAALVCSYLSWTSEEGTDEDDTIVMLDADLEDIEKVTWDSEKLDVVLVGKSDERGDYLWVTTTERKRVPKEKSHDNPDPEAGDPTEHDGIEGNEDDGTEGQEPPEPPELPEEDEYEDKVKHFKAGGAGDDLLTSLAPMEAARVLSGVGEDKYEDFGLTEPDATLTVQRKGKEAKVFKIGGEAYGTRDRYVLDTGEGIVYLVDQDLLRPLKYATTRLPDRNLTELGKAEITRVSLSTICEPLETDCEGVTVELEQQNAQDKDNAFWAPVGSDEPSETAEAWLDKALGLKSASYVQDEDQPIEIAPKLHLIVQDDETVTTIEISRGVNPDGDETWYARSEHTRELVRLHRTQASEVVEDVESVLDI